MQEHTRIESMKLRGSELTDKVKELLHEGNVRRIIIKHEGHTVLEIPVTVGVVAVIVAPVLAAIGAIAVLLAEYTIEVERVDHPTIGE